MVMPQWRKPVALSKSEAVSMISLQKSLWSGMRGYKSATVVKAWAEAAAVLSADTSEYRRLERKTSVLFLNWSLHGQYFSENNLTSLSAVASKIFEFFYDPTKQCLGKGTPLVANPPLTSRCDLNFNLCPQWLKDNPILVCWCETSSYVT